MSPTALGLSPGRSGRTSERFKDFIETQDTETGLGAAESSTTPDLCHARHEGRRLMALSPHGRPFASHKQ